MEHSNLYQKNKKPRQPPGIQPDDRLRLIKLARGDVWPERQSCELVLVLGCRSTGFQMTDLDGHICVGELALLPRGNGLIASAHGRVLSARMETLPAPTAPQRLRDRLIALLLKRAWASAFTSTDIVAPTLELVEILAASKVRAHQERLDLLERVDPRIARVLDYIEAHLGDAMTVRELAAIACLSPGHFSRSFKAAIDAPVWTYVQRRRCERARDMLAATQEPIAEIAHACGFASQAHLTTHFRETFGDTPAAYRKALT